MKIDWKPEDIEQLIKLKEQNKQWEEVAAALGRSKASVMCKWDSMREDKKFLRSLTKKNASSSWDNPKDRSVWGSTRSKLAGQFKFDAKNGYILHGRPVTVQEMMRIAGELEQ